LAVVFDFPVPPRKECTDTIVATGRCSSHPMLLLAIGLTSARRHKLADRGRGADLRQTAR
jgi:hypothetical protein